MGARQYDPAIARWTVIDPVVHYSMSPYNAFDNNPVYWADPSGADAYDTAMILFNRSGSGITTYARGDFFSSSSNIFTEVGHVSDEKFVELSGVFGLGNSNVAFGEASAMNTAGWQQKSFEATLKSVLKNAKIDEKITSKELIEKYGIPKEAASLINSFIKISDSSVEVDWVSSWNPKMAMVKTVSDAVFKDGTITINYQNGKTYISGNAIGIKFNETTYYDLILKGNDVYLKNVKTSYYWKIGN